MTFFPETNSVLPNRAGKPLHITTTLPNGATSAPLVFILHGFKGFRNYSFLPWISQHAAMHGMIAIRFCFSGNGMNGTSWMVQDLDAFAANTISQEVDDVHDMISLVKNDPSFSAVREQWNGQIFIIGHSRGGGIAQIVSRELVEHGTAPSVRTAVYNSVGTWMRWTDRQRAEWAKAGTFSFTNERTKQIVRMDLSYVEDIESNAERLSLDSAATILGDRLAFFHAEHDLTVPLTEIVALRSRTNTAASLHIIPNTTHTFGMTHPVDRITHGFVAVLKESFSWLLQ